MERRLQVNTNNSRQQPLNTAKIVYFRLYAKTEKEKTNGKRKSTEKEKGTEFEAHAATYTHKTASHILLRAFLLPEANRTPSDFLVTFSDFLVTFSDFLVTFSDFLVTLLFFYAFIISAFTILYTSAANQFQPAFNTFQYYSIPEG